MSTNDNIDNETGVSTHRRRILPRGGRSTFAFALAAAGAVIGVSSIASAVADPMLDTSFSTDGIVTTNVSGNSWDWAVATALQSDGKIVAVGYSETDIAVMRYNTDGSLDSTFDGDGIAITDLGANDYGYAVALQPNGKIIVGGQTTVGGAYDFALVRYNTNGSLDSTFDGDGIAITDIHHLNNDFDYISSVALQSDGKIVVAGVSQSSSTSYDFIVARYTTTGGLDNTFDGDGIAITDIDTGSDDETYAIKVQSDDKIVVAGVSDAVASYDFAILRYNTDGSLDNTFDSDGIVTTDISSGSVDFGNALAIQDDGKLVVAGNKCTSGVCDIVVVRYTTIGGFDSNFGSGGIVITNFGNGTDDGTYATAIQNDGKILVGGYSDINGSNDFAVVRYTAGGVLDSTFGTGGIATTDIGSSSNDVVNAIALQSDGKVIAVGHTALSGSNDFALVRYYQSAPSSTTTSSTTSTTTAAPSEPTTTTAASSSPTSTSATGQPSTTVAVGSLPETGSNSTPMTVWAALVVSVGLLVLFRRRLTN